MLLIHESMDDAVESAKALQSMGWRARKVLAEVVETSGIVRTTVSRAAKNLEDVGFLLIRDIGNGWDNKFELVPTLFGEEALQVLDEIEDRLHQSLIAPDAGEREPVMNERKEQ